MARPPETDTPFNGMDLRKLIRIAESHGIKYEIRRKTGDGVFSKPGHGLVIFNSRRKDATRAAVLFVKRCMTS